MRNHSIVHCMKVHDIERWKWKGLVEWVREQTFPGVVTHKSDVFLQQLQLRNNVVLSDVGAGKVSSGIHKGGKTTYEMTVCLQSETKSHFKVHVHCTGNTDKGRWGLASQTRIQRWKQWLKILKTVCKTLLVFDFGSSSQEHAWVIPTWLNIIHVIVL